MPSRDYVSRVGPILGGVRGPRFLPDFFFLPFLYFKLNFKAFYDLFFVLRSFKLLIECRILI